MADQPISGDASAAVEEPTQPISQPASANEPTTPKDDGFQRAQAKWEQRNRQLLNQVEQANRQIQQLQQQLDQLQMQNLPDDQRQAYQANQYIRQLQAQLQQVQQNEQQYRIDLQANSELMEIAEEFEVPFTKLRQMYEEGKRPNEIWRSAAKEYRERQAKAEKQAARQEKQENNRVDLGSGRASTTMSEWEAAVAEAEKNKDAVAYTRLMRTRPAQ